MFTRAPTREPRARTLQTREVVDPRTGRPGFVFWLGSAADAPPTLTVPDPSPTAQSAAWWLVAVSFAAGAAAGYVAAVL